MVKYWLKNRFAFDLIIGIALSLLFCFAFVYPSNADYERVYSSNSLYVNNEIDFQIPNPSVSQLKAIDEEPFVDDAFGYYLTKTKVAGWKNSDVNLIMSDCMGSLDFTMYNSKTLVSSGATETNYAYIDETAAQALSVSNGDRIKASIANSQVEFTVTRIYEANTLFKEGTVLVDFAGAVKEIYEANASANSYSGAFLKASDVSQCNSFLGSYIPKGRLKDRFEFDSDEAYETYNNAIKSGNYSNEITNFSELRALATKEISDLQSKRNLMAVIGSVVVGVAYLLFNELLRVRKSENKYFSDVLKNKKSIASYRVCSAVLSAAIYEGLMIVLLMILNASPLLGVSIGISLAFFALTFIVNLLQDKKYKKTSK